MRMGFLLLLVLLASGCSLLEDFAALELPTIDPADLIRAVREDNVRSGSVTFLEGGALGAEPVLNAPHVAPGRLISFGGAPTFGGGTFSPPDGAILYNFWASWCGPCREEFPMLAHYNAHDDAPFTVVFINTMDEEADARAFLVERDHDAGGVIHDESGVIAETTQIAGLPTSILVSAAGMVDVVHIGLVTQPVLALMEAAARGEVLDVTLSPLDALLLKAEQSNMEEGNQTFWREGAFGVPLGIAHHVAVGDPFPDFAEGDFDLAAHRAEAGKSLLVNFWATWCPPCIIEYPLLAEVAQNPGAPLVVVFVNVWDDAAAFEDAKADAPEGVPFLRSDALADQVGVGGIPTSFLIDGEGTVMAIHVGNITPPVMDLLFYLAEEDID